MTPFWFFLILGLVGLALIFLGARSYEGLMGPDWPVLDMIAGGLIVVFAIIPPTIIYLTRHFERVTCKSYAAQAHRETKFVLYNSWDTGDCLVKIANGKWISKDALNGFSDAP